MSGSTDITNFGPFGGVVKVAVIISNNLLSAVQYLLPSVVAMIKGTGDNGYSHIHGLFIIYN